MTNMSYGRRGEILKGIIDSFSNRACISKFFKSLDMNNYIDRYILFEVMQRYRDDENIAEYIDGYINSVHGATTLEYTSVADDLSRRLIQLHNIVNE